jgi:hypothetical protein
MTILVTTITYPGPGTDVYVNVYDTGGVRTAYFCEKGSDEPIFVPPNILYRNVYLWTRIAVALEADGIRLITQPPANQAGPPRNR